MAVARRLIPFGTSVFAEMTRLAERHGAINLAQGFPDFDGPEHVKRAAIGAIESGHSQYAPMPGLPVLTRAIASDFQGRAGIAVDPSTQVTITAGCTEAIAAALLGLLEPGDEVILLEPFYDSYRACLAMSGAVVRFVTLRAPGFVLNEADLDRTVRDSRGKARALILNTPHNPTGRVFTKAEMEGVARVCLKHGLIAITDEVYERLIYEPAQRPHIHLASLPGMADRTITLSSLGKTFSLTGWKIGWSIAPPDLTNAVRAAHQFLTFAVSTPMQHAAATALASPPSYFQALANDYRRKRDLLGAALREAGFAFRDPEGSYFIYADHTTVSRRLGVEDDVSLCKALIERCGVAAIPPSAFYENKAEGRRLVRFAFCKRDETLRAAIERLSRLGS